MNGSQIEEQQQDPRGRREEVVVEEVRIKKVRIKEACIEEVSSQVFRKEGFYVEEELIEEGACKENCCESITISPIVSEKVTIEQPISAKHREEEQQKESDDLERVALNSGSCRCRFAGTEEEGKDLDPKESRWRDPRRRSSRRFRCGHHGCSSEKPQDSSHDGSRSDSRVDRETGRKSRNGGRAG